MSLLSDYLPFKFTSSSNASAGWEYVGLCCGQIWSEILVRLHEKYCCVYVRNTGLSPLK